MLQGKCYEVLRSCVALMKVNKRSLHAEIIGQNTKIFQMLGLTGLKWDFTPDSAKRNGLPTQLKSTSQLNAQQKVKKCDNILMNTSLRLRFLLAQARQNTCSFSARRLWIQIHKIWSAWISVSVICFSMWNDRGNKKQQSCRDVTSLMWMISFNSVIAFALNYWNMKLQRLIWVYLITCMKNDIKA